MSEDTSVTNANEPEDAERGQVPPPWKRGETTAATGLTAGDVAKSAPQITGDGVSESGGQGSSAPSSAPTRAVPAVGPEAAGAAGRPPVPASGTAPGQSGGRPTGGPGGPGSPGPGQQKTGSKGPGQNAPGPGKAAPTGSSAAGPTGAQKPGAQKAGTQKPGTQQSGSQQPGPQQNVPGTTGSAPKAPAPAGPIPKNPPPQGMPAPAKSAPPQASAQAATSAVATPKPAEERPDLDAIHKTGAKSDTSDRAAVRRIPASSSIGTPLRAAVQVRRVDPWSIFKVSGVLAVAGFLIWMIAVAVLYGVLAGMGIWDQINSSFSTIVSADGSSTSDELITTGQVFGFAALFGIFAAIVLTALSTILAYIYNVCADVVGGVEVTLADLD